MIKPIIKYVVDGLGNKIGALPSTSKSLAEYSDIIEQGVRLDTPDSFKNIFHADQDYAREYGGDLKSGSMMRDSDVEYSNPLSIEELLSTKKELQELTQEYLKDLPDDLTVYRYGKLNDETGVSSFTLNPNYSVESSLPWQKRLQSPMQTFKVKKEDILVSPDISNFFGGGRIFDEQEVIISNDKIGALSDTSYRGTSMPNRALADQTYPRLHEANPNLFAFEKDKLFNKEAVNIINKVANKPNDEVTMYRVVPNSDDINNINVGDFVTMSLEKAKEFKKIADGMSDYKPYVESQGFNLNSDSNSKIIKQKAKAKDIVTTDIDINEYTYFPSGEE